MREDLKERLRALAKTGYIQHLIEYWSNDDVHLEDDGYSLWPGDFEARDMWPDSRVEAFLNWAEQTEANNGEK